MKRLSPKFHEQFLDSLFRNVEQLSNRLLHLFSLENKGEDEGDDEGHSQEEE